MARSSDPPPGNNVLWRGLQRLTEIQIGVEIGMKLVGKAKTRLMGYGITSRKEKSLLRRKPFSRFKTISDRESLLNDTNNFIRSLKDKALDFRHQGPTVYKY